MTLTWYMEVCLSSAETNGVNDDLDRPFPAESRESNAFYSASAILLLQTRTIFQKSPFRQRGYGGIVGERDNQLKILLLYVLDKASILLSTASALINFKPNSSTSCLIAANTLSNSITFSSVSRFRFRSRTLR